MDARAREWFLTRTSQGTSWCRETLAIEKGNLKVGVVLPARNEAATVGPIVERICRELMVQVALVDEGPIRALIVLIGVIAVQQLEGHVLQPLIMGRAVSVHPLAVIVAISTGVVLAGIIGALVAVPLVAVLNTGIRHLV